MFSAIQTSEEPWRVSEAAFPGDGTVAQKLRFCLNYAVLAPSTRNTQPWLFKIRGDGLELYADRTRSLSRVDPDDRELTMSCGAALLHLRLALRHFGYETQVETFPDPADDDLLARVVLGEAREGTPQEHTLFRMILKRHTSRLPFEDLDVPDKVPPVLQAMARSEGAALHLIAGAEARNLIGDLIETADRIQWADKLVRYQIAGWLHPRGSSSSDGIPASAFETDDPLSHVGPEVVRLVNMGAEQAVKDRRKAVEAPLLAVLTTGGDTPAEWLAAGQAMEKVLLCACAAGLSASYLNQPLEVPALRPQLRGVLAQVLGHQGCPQLVFRLGYGPEVPPTPRRSVSEVLL